MPFHDGNRPPAFVAAPDAGPVKKVLAEVWAVVKADPRLRKASAAFYGAAGLGILAAVSDLSVSSGELRNVAVVSLGAALAAWRLPNKPKARR